MTNFLKKFFSGEKSPEEQTLQKKHDVLRLDSATTDKEEEQEDCSTPAGGCCGGRCH